MSYEVEGLLHLALHRGDDTPRQVWQMIEEHLRVMTEGVVSQLADVAGASDVEPDSCSDVVEESEICSNGSVATPVVDAVDQMPDIESEPLIEIDNNIIGVDEVPVADSEEKELQEITLDEKLARDNSRCLRKAFSLNDRFRFRRELFGNSDVAMADTIDLVEAMHSVDEACDYFFEELGWDTDNDEVKDFMDIISKHFLAR